MCQKNFCIAEAAEYNSSKISTSGRVINFASNFSLPLNRKIDDVCIRISSRTIDGISSYHCKTFTGMRSRLIALRNSFFCQKSSVSVLARATFDARFKRVRKCNGTIIPTSFFLSIITIRVHIGVCPRVLERSALWIIPARVRLIRVPFVSLCFRKKLTLLSTDRKTERSFLLDRR